MFDRVGPEFFPTWVQDCDSPKIASITYMVCIKTEPSTHHRSVSVPRNAFYWINPRDQCCNSGTNK